MLQDFEVAFSTLDFYGETFHACSITFDGLAGHGVSRSKQKAQAYAMENVARMMLEEAQAYVPERKQQP